MQAARRLYLYVMSGVTLAVIATGLAVLIDVLITESGVLRHPSGSFTDARQQISQAVALLGVGAPVWAVHWWLVQRGLSPGRPRHDAEHGSAIRAGYLTLVLLVALVVWVNAAIGLIQAMLADLANVSTDLFFVDPVTSAAAGSVGLLIWLYHGIVRRRDLAAGPVHGTGAWLPRLYLYGVSLGALVTSLGALGSAVSSFVLAPDIVDDYSRVAAVGAAVTAAAWGLAWFGHWGYASALARAADWRGVESGRRGRAWPRSSRRSSSQPASRSPAPPARSRAFSACSSAPSRSEATVGGAFP